jgi:hypothetical protein
MKNKFYMVFHSPLNAFLFDISLIEIGQEIKLLEHLKKKLDHPVYTGCLIKNASTHNFFIYYPISMNKKTEDMVFHALRSRHKIIIFGVIFSNLR